MRNEWSNYTNWPYYHVPSDITIAPHYIVNYRQPNGKIVNSGLYISGNYAQENRKHIMENMAIVLDGKYRENSLPRGIFDYVEKYARTNGFSKGVNKSLNCGRGSKDRKKNINKNLNYVAKKMKVDKSKLILMHQTHSNKVVEIKKSNYKKKIVADAMITKMNDVTLGVLTAECVPIIIYDVRNKIIGCIHAGW